MTDAVVLPPEQTAEEDAHVPTRRLLVFEVARTHIACEMEAFREIVPARRFTRLPGAPETVCGLINLRGTIVTVLDGGVVLGKAACSRTGLILLIGDAEKLIGLGVDDVRDVHDVPMDQFFAASAGEVSAMQFVTGIVEIDEQRVLVVDIKSAARQVIGHGR
ncbi:MAG: chemotaxis protein CheW [Gemmatimonadaceae bacterium]